MTVITDDEMKSLMPTTRGYTVVIVRPGPHLHDEGADKIIWEHGAATSSYARTVC